MTTTAYAYFDNPLFAAVQAQRVFPDGKTFVDCVPRGDLQELIRFYLAECNQPGFNLAAFVHRHFTLPVPHSAHHRHNEQLSVTENINQLWDALTRQPGPAAGSLIPLPFPYVVPGGRFGEIYYWDSYFTMLGLQAAGKITLVENMVKNFAWLIDQYGFIPNGNRTYFSTRSQPPFFALMVLLLRETSGDAVLKTYLPQLLREYAFWMNRKTELTAGNPADNRVVLMPDGALLNRYWDAADSPRPESWREDMELYHQHPQPGLFRHLRAGAESGWDYSSRWLRDGKNLGSIHTTDIIPVDLNCLLYLLETTIATACRLQEDNVHCQLYQQLAEARMQAIRRYCWNETAGFYMDYDFMKQQQTGIFSLAGVFPLFAGLATEREAGRIAEKLQTAFLKAGGLVCTLTATGQQWDAPNGWAPLQWICIEGLEKYGFTEAATETARRWVTMNIEVFSRTGKFMEKYNVADTSLEAGGGEYTGQDGFGWTNAVLQALLSRYSIPVNGLPAP